MSDQDLFQKEGTPAATPADPNQILALVKREDGTQKYATLEDLAKGAAHAQDHIKKLEAEIASMKEGREKTALEAILEKLAPPAAQAPATPAAQPTGVKLEEVEAVVQRLKAKELAEANAKSIRDELIKVAGSEEAAATLLHDKATASGLSTVELSALAAKSPAAARKLLGLGEQPNLPARTTPSVSGHMPGTEPPRKRVMLGGASTADTLAAFRKHKPQ